MAGRRRGQARKGVKKKIRKSGSGKTMDAAVSKAKRIAAESQGGGGDGATNKVNIDNMDAVKSMGITVGADGKVDTQQARKVAEGAAVSAAAAMGINIMKPDGKIDTAKARQAVGAILGFSTEKDGAGRHAEAAEVVRQSIIDSADAVGADIKNADGDIDMEKARTFADAALGFAVQQKAKLDRRESLEAMETNLSTYTNFSKLTREEASANLEKLAKASVLENGQISARKALEVRDAAIAAAKKEADAVQPTKPKISKRAARKQLNQRRQTVAKK